LHLTDSKTKVREVLSRAWHGASKLWLRPARLLILAAVFHLALTLTIYGLGRRAVFPGTFDGNGIGVSFALDGAQHRADAAHLSEILARGEFHAWLTIPYPFHVKLYSISFALFGPLLGYTIVGAEPLNAAYYLAILVLVFNLGRELFNQRTGLIAAAAVALWPSLLLHTTQFLKEPLFLAGTLAFILILLRYLTRSHSWRGALLTGAAGGLIAAVLWLARDNMSGIVVAILVLAAVLFVIRQFVARRVQITNLAGIVLLIAITICAQQVLPRISLAGPAAASARMMATRRQSPPASDMEAAARATSVEAPSSAPWSRAAASVWRARRKFINRYPNAGSNIDRNVQLLSAGDVLLYLPRAAAIGFFAPFPNMWVTAGKEVGSGGRLLAGLETFVIYCVYCLALYGLWRARRRLPVWFLFSVAVIGMIALGFVVINIGALFRLRYVFWILLIILGAEGAGFVLERFSKKQEPEAPA